MHRTNRLAIVSIDFPHSLVIPFISLRGVFQLFDINRAFTRSFAATIDTCVLCVCVCVCVRILAGRFAPISPNAILCSARVFNRRRRRRQSLYFRACQFRNYHDAWFIREKERERERELRGKDRSPFIPRHFFATHTLDRRRRGDLRSGRARARSKTAGKATTRTRRKEEEECRRSAFKIMPSLLFTRHLSPPFHPSSFNFRSSHFVLLLASFPFFSISRFQRAPFVANFHPS